MDDVGPVHGEEDRRPFVRPSWVRSTKREACKSCHRVLAVEGETLTATTPETGPAEPLPL